MNDTSRKIADAIIQTNKDLLIDVHTDDGLSRTRKGIMSLMAREGLTPNFYKEIIDYVTLHS